VYRSRNGVTTWRLDHGGLVHYLKMGWHGWWPGLGAEADRMRWAGRHLPVPRVLSAGRDAEMEWLLTTAVPGRNALDDQLRSRPEILVPLLSTGLRRFHDDTPVSDCPFDFTVSTALAGLRERLEKGMIVPGRSLDAMHGRVTLDSALEVLEFTRPVEQDLVVCHGDYCPPNVLLANGEITGFVDLGDLGVADRWWDVAIGAWSVSANFGAEWEETFFRSYAIVPDTARIAFYRLLHDLHRQLLGRV